MTDLREYLHSYTGINDEDMDKIVAYFKVTTMNKGDYYLKTGKVCDNVSFQRSGLLRVYASHGEKEITQWISSKGNFIADLGGIICDTPSRFNICALTYSELYTISKKDFLNLPNVIPEWHTLERTMITRCFGFMETRVFALLSMSAEEQYKYLMDLSPELFTQVPLKYLASMMGMTPESLSRVRSKMAGIVG